MYDMTSDGDPPYQHPVGGFTLSLSFLKVVIGHIDVYRSDFIGSFNTIPEILIKTCHTYHTERI
jgi:hypothetical protein